MKRRIESRFSVKWILKIICLSSVIVSANNSTQNDQVKTNSYTAIMVSTTTIPTAMLGLSEKTVYDERTLQSMMMGMVDGKEKIYSYKKKGIMGTHNLDIKLPAQESFFCKLIKKQSVIMFSFCDQGSGWGWSSDDKKAGKKKKKAKKKKKKKKAGGNKKKKSGGGKGGGKKKKKGGGKKKSKSKSKKKKKGGQQQGWGQKEPEKKKGWKPPEKKKGWKPPPEPPKGWGGQEEPPVTKGWGQEKEKEKESKGWGEEKEEEKGGWGGEEDDWQAEGTDKKKGESDDDFGATSQDDDYKPKKNYKSKVRRKPGKIQSAVPVSTSYLSEFDLNKWQSSDAVKNNPEDIVNHHFYRAGST